MRFRTFSSGFILEFNRHYSSEEECENELRQAREKSVVVCSVCGGINRYWYKCRKSWVCKGCHHETTLTSGTIMYGSKLPLLIWFTAIHLITSTKNSFSGKRATNGLDTLTT